MAGLLIRTIHVALQTELYELFVMTNSDCDFCLGSSHYIRISNAGRSIIIMVGEDAVSIILLDEAWEFDSQDTQLLSKLKELICRLLK